MVLFGYADSLCILAGRLAWWIFRLGVSSPHGGDQHLLGNAMDRMISMNIEEILPRMRVTSLVPRS